MIQKNSAFSNFEQALQNAGKKAGTQVDRAKIALVLGKVKNFLTTTGSVANVQALESFKTSPVMNQLSAERDIGSERFLKLVEECGVPAERRVAVATECARYFIAAPGSEDALAKFEPGAEHVSAVDLWGTSAQQMIRHGNQHALEAFGTDIDKLQQDNRISIVLTILRSFNSIIDKVLPRVPEETNVVTMSVKAPEVYDLHRSMDTSSKVRNGADTKTDLVDVYKSPELVNTMPQQIIPLASNDTDDKASIFQETDGFLQAGVSVNLFDLTMQNRIGFNAVDYTDLVAEGAQIDTVLVQGASADGTKTEIFPVYVRFIPQSSFTQMVNGNDSGDASATVQFGTVLAKGALTWKVNGTGPASTLITFDDADLKLDLNFTAVMNLKTGDLTGSGSVSKTPVPTTVGVEVSDDTVAAIKALNFTIVGYSIFAQFDEENMRKTTMAVRVQYLQRQFQIPMGRNFIVDYSLQQPDDENATQTMNVFMALGNTIRGLTIIESKLNDVADAVAFVKQNPAAAHYIKARNISYAGTLVKPTVIKTGINYDDGKLANMRESERLPDMHARLRALTLAATSQLKADSLYPYSLEPGEKAVWKCITYQTIGDVLFGIKDYHNTLNDVVPPATGVDYSMDLQSGDRLDIIKVVFDSYKGKIIIVPVRENAPEDITSFGSIRDRGTYAAQYTPLNQGGVARRIVANSREIVLPTNPIGVLIDITGLTEQLNAINTYALDL